MGLYSGKSERKEGGEGKETAYPPHLPFPIFRKGSSAFLLSRRWGEASWETGAQVLGGGWKRGEEGLE